MKVAEYFCWIAVAFTKYWTHRKHRNLLYKHRHYTLSEAWSGVNWADLMAAQGAFGTDFYDRSTNTNVGTMLWTEYRPIIKMNPGQP